MDRRLFLLSSTSAVATSLSKPVFSQTWQNNFEVTRDASGAILRPEMLGANILAQNNRVTNTLINNNYDDRRNSVGVRGVIRWPGGSIAEGRKTEGGGDWIANTGIDYGDFLSANSYAPRQNCQRPPNEIRPDPGDNWGRLEENGQVSRRNMGTTLKEFLAYCNSNADVQPIIVVPTIRFLFPRPYSGDRVRYQRVTKYIREFAQYVYWEIDCHYPNVQIFAWEIGNEYDAGDAAMTPVEYAMIAETAARAIRGVRGTAKVAIQAGPLSQTVSIFAPHANTIYNQFTNRASQNNTRLPEYLVHHAYTSFDTGYERLGEVLEFIQTRWSGTPTIVTEWNTHNSNDDYNNTSAQYRLGMERAFRITAMFDTMVTNNVHAACFWPVVASGVGTPMFRGSPERFISADVFSWLSEIWAGEGASNQMRRATIQYTPINTTGSAIEIFAFCRDDRRSAKVFIFPRGAVEQDVRIAIKGMRSSLGPFSARRMHGPTGAIVFDVNNLPKASIQGIPVSQSPISGGREYTVRVRTSGSPYEAIVLDAQFS